MYDELYATWKREIENKALQPLDADFYVRVSEYVKRIKKEITSADERTLEGRLLAREKNNAIRLINELLKVRYKKVVKTIRSGQELPLNLFSSHEAETFKSFSSFVEKYRAFAKGLIQGQQSSSIVAETPSMSHQRVVLRFKKAVPAIIGSDMKTYGPFASEDVASVPVENAQILVKQGFAEVIEVS